MQLNLKTKFILFALVTAAVVLASHLITTIAYHNETLDQHLGRLLALNIGSILLTLSLPLYAIRYVFKPQDKLADTMRVISSGDLSVEVPYIKRRDEIGDIARMVNIFRENARSMVELFQERAREQPANEERSRKTMSDIANTLEKQVKEVVDMVAAAASEIESASQSVMDNTTENKSKLDALTVQISSASDNVQNVAGATSQLSSAVSEINHQINRSASITATAVEDAVKADGTVKGLTEAAQKIGEVVEMINSIAAQINLLALNATIEAARAGDAGKGFAVVASEVKSLAAQTTKATEQIGQFITSIQGATQDTVSVITQITVKIHEINNISTTIAAAVEEQSVTTQEIAGHAQKAAENTSGIARNASDVAKSTEDTGNAVSQMAMATSELTQHSEKLRTQMDGFIKAMRGEKEVEVEKLPEIA